MKSPEEKIEALNDISLKALTPEDSAFLCLCLEDDIYAVASKAYLTAERCGDVNAASQLCAGFFDAEREWQLRALAVLSAVKTPEALACFRRCLFQRRKPLLIRGAAVALVKGGKAAEAELFASFLLSPYSGYLKDVFLGDCLQCLLDNGEASAVWAARCDNDRQLAAISAALLAKAGGKELLSVYPYPDYLTRKAEERGLSPREWKKVTFFPRHKNRRKKWNAERRFSFYFALRI